MHKRIKISDKKMCCGCLSCKISCPKKAINYYKSVDGSLYPNIDEEKCIDCGICANVCNFKNKKYFSKPNKGYVAITKDENLLNKSTSGGIFSTIAKKYLENNWKICGCISYIKDGKYIAEHVLTNDYSVVEKMFGSKYVQSTIVNALCEIKKSLMLGEKILFSGTPCQISALKGFLKKEYDNLYTIEIICHGAPSQKMLNDYIEYYNKKHNCLITNLQFRTKKYGWKNIGQITYKNNSNKRIKTKDFIFNESSYYYLFEKGYFFRESCYSCPFSGEMRTGDITIGDFWGIEKVHSELLDKINVNKGVSCILANSNKGNEIIRTCKDNFYLYNSNFNKIRKYNRQLNEPTKRPKDMDEILKLYNKYGYEVIERFFKSKIKHHKIEMLKNKIKKILKKL